MFSINTKITISTESKVDPTCWQTITEDRNTYCLIAREKELYKILQGENVYSMLTVSFEKEYTSIVAMSISYNHKFLALYTNNGIVWMGTADLQTKYCEFDTGRKEKPKQIEWWVVADYIIFVYKVTSRVFCSNAGF